MRSNISLGILFACIIAVFAFMLNSISHIVVSNGVNDIELKDAEEDMNELYSLLGAATIRLKHHVYDWAVFDEAYDYVQGKDKRLVDRSFSQEKLMQMHFTGAGVYSIDGNRLAFVDGSNLSLGEKELEKEKQIFDRIAKMIQSRDSDTQEGFINVHGVGMIVAAHKIYDSVKKNPFNGYLIMGIALGSRFKEEAQKVSGLRFSIVPLDRYAMADGRTIKDNLKSSETPDVIRVYSVVYDIFGQPAFCIELEKPRTIAAFGRELSRKNFALMLVLCILVLCAGLVLLHLTQKRITRKEMDYRARHDSLTGLPNERCFEERLSEIMKDARHDGISLGVLDIDIDNFKSINDCFGYKQGDILLQNMANRIRRLISAGSAARFGADNFVAAVTAKDTNTLMADIKKIHAALHEPFEVNGSPLHMGVRMGIAFLNDDSINAVTLVHHAEQAMFEAKKQGGNTLAVFNESMHRNAIERKNLEIALRDAVEKNALTVYYQPKVDIEKNDVAGCEALIRWRTSDGKWVPPPAFIPIAEENGLVTRIDMFVLRSACRQALEWQKDGTGAVPIAVNMSVLSILSDGFADEVTRILKEEGTPPSLIDIEITESCFMSDMKKALSAFSRLHDSGIHIALDDFGTGYSSLQYLSAMPISILKIDKKFVDDIFSGKETAQTLVKSIISLAGGLGLQTVSEGVEDKDQLAFLVRNGAHIIQGYLFSKPLSAEDCGAFLRNRKVRIAEVMKAA